MVWPPVKMSSCVTDNILVASRQHSFARSLRSKTSRSSVVSTDEDIGRSVWIGAFFKVFRYLLSLVDDRITDVSPLLCAQFVLTAGRGLIRVDA